MADDAETIRQLREELRQAKEEVEHGAGTEGAAPEQRRDGCDTCAAR